jgi:hypothetical protein
MKKAIAILMLILLSTFVVGCSENYSTDKYDEICDYVSKNKENVVINSEVEYYNYEIATEGFQNITYGYYYTEKDEILSCAQNKMSLPTEYTELGDGGYYFGEVSDTGDWSFVRKITNNWYYFETHDYIY